jgi:hypothetical protein
MIVASTNNSDGDFSKSVHRGSFEIAVHFFGTMARAPGNSAAFILMCRGISLYSASVLPEHRTVGNTNA